MERTNRFNICIHSYSLGKDRVFHITGGMAHIGAAATAYFLDNEIKVKVQAVPGHREGPLAAELARRSALLLKRTITVVIGIHIDKATREMIRSIVEEVKAGMERELARLLCYDK